MPSRLEVACLRGEAGILAKLGPHHAYQMLTKASDFSYKRKTLILLKFISVLVYKQITQNAPKFSTRIDFCAVLQFVRSSSYTTRQAEIELLTH